MTAKNFFYLCLIFLFGLFLRVYMLGAVPAGFTPDEASQAYTAYSLLNTGKDEWGISWPTSSFRSFLDYKSALQTYLMIPTISIFGLNEFAARLPSAIFGSLAIISSFALVVALTKNIKLSLLTSFILATSPWAIQFSRMALEANLAVFLITSGLNFLLRSFEKPNLLILSAALFSISLYSYHAAKLFVPIFLFVIFAIYKKNFLKTPKILIASFLVALVLCLPLIRNLSGEDSKRGADLLITNISSDHLKSLNDTIFYHDLYQDNQYLPRLFHNKITLVANNFVNNYLSYFSLHFWFLEGGREITYSVIPGRGLLLLYLLPFFIYGLISVTKSNLPKSIKLLLLAWLILAPLPAALTKEGYRPNRAISFMFLLEFISAYGLYSFLSQTTKYFQLKRTFVILVFCFSFVFYLEDYTYASKVKFPESMSYGWREAVGFLAKSDSNYKQVIVEQGNQSQAMIAFYKKLDPNIFQSYSPEWSEQISRNKDIKYLDQLSNYSLQNYIFKSFAWPEDVSSDTLYLSHKLNNLPSERRTLKQIISPQGKILMEVFDFPKK